MLLVASGPALLAPLIPASWEDAAGSVAEHAAVGGHRRCRGADGQRALDRFMAELTAFSNLPAVRLVVVDDGLVQCVHPAGPTRIVVERGLIDAAEDGGGAGRRAGSRSRAHRPPRPAKALVREVGFSVVAAALGWTGVSSGGIARTLLELSYGRSAEGAADAFSIKALREAGLRADGLGPLLRPYAGQVGGRAQLPLRPPGDGRPPRAGGPATRR